MDVTECTTAANHSGHFIIIVVPYKFADYYCAARMVCIGACQYFC